MYVEIEYPAGGVERSFHPIQMHIKLLPEPDFKGGNDGDLLNQLLAKLDTKGEVIEIVLRDPKGEEKFRISARLTSFSTTWETLVKAGKGKSVP